MIVQDLQILSIGVLLILVLMAIRVDIVAEQALILDLFAADMEFVVIKDVR